MSKVFQQNAEEIGARIEAMVSSGESESYIEATIALGEELGFTEGAMGKLIPPTIRVKIRKEAQDSGAYKPEGDDFEGVV